MGGGSPRPFTDALLASILGLTLLSGCVSEPTAADPDAETGLPKPQATEFLVATPAVGDVALFASTYSVAFAGQATQSFEGEQRLTVPGFGKHPDGFGATRDVYEVNLTSMTDGAEAYWETFWVDLASNDQVASRYGPDGGGGAYRAELGPLATEAHWNRTSFTDSWEAGNILRDAGVLGGFVQGRILPREGDWDRTSPAWDEELAFTTSPDRMFPEGPAAGHPVYSVSTEGTNGAGLAYSFTALVSPNLPWVLSIERTFTFEDRKERYAVELLSFEPGTTPVQPFTGLLTLAASSLPDGELGATFPIGGTRFLAFTPIQAKEAAMLGDPDIAAWFEAHPEAFLSLGNYYLGYMQDVVGATYAVPEDHRRLVHAAFWYTEFTALDSGETIGFHTFALIGGSSAQPPLHLRHHPFEGEPAAPNLVSYEKDDWLREMGGVASLTDAVARFQDTAGPYQGTMPNVVHWRTAPDRAIYFLTYEERAGTRDSAFFEMGYNAKLPLHHVAMRADGYLMHAVTAAASWQETGNPV